MGWLLARAEALTTFTSQLLSISFLSLIIKIEYEVKRCREYGQIDLKLVYYYLMFVFWKDMIWWWYEMNDKMEILISILFRFHHLLIKFIKIDIMSKSIFTSLGLLKTMKELLSPLFLVFIFIIWIGLFWDRKRNGCCRLWEREMVEITLSFYLSSSYLIFDQLYPISSYHHNTPYRIIQKIWGWNLWTILLIWWPLPTHASVKFIYRDGRWYGEWYEIVDGEWDGKYFKYFIVRWWMRYGRWWMRFGEWDGKYFMMIDDWW